MSAGQRKRSITPKLITMFNQVFGKGSELSEEQLIGYCPS
jgi:hypothetical protein